MSTGAHQDMRLHPRTGLPVFGDLAENINEEKLRLVLCADKDCNATSSVRQVRTATGAAGIVKASEFSFGFDRDGLPAFLIKERATDIIKLIACTSDECTGFASSTTLIDNGTFVSVRALLFPQRGSAADAVHSVGVVHRIDGTAAILMLECADRTCSSFGTTIPAAVDPPAELDFTVSFTDQAVATVAFGFYSTAEQAVVVASCAVAACGTPTLAIVAENITALYVNLVVGADGSPLVGFATRKTLHVAKCRTVDCSIVNPTLLVYTDHGNGIEYSPAIAIGPDGVPVLAWQESRGVFSIGLCDTPDCGSVERLVVDVGAELDAFDHFAPSSMRFGMFNPDGSPIFLYSSARFSTALGRWRNTVTLATCGACGVDSDDTGRGDQCEHITESPTTPPTTSTPSAAPTGSPASSVPTGSPSMVPTSSVPSGAPTAAPTGSPASSVPTGSPSMMPTSSVPSGAPTAAPTGSPASSVPSTSPTMVPTTSAPSAAPTTIVPSAAPRSSGPTPAPTLLPSPAPTANPTPAPSLNPTSAPTASPAVAVCSDVGQGMFSFSNVPRDLCLDQDVDCSGMCCFGNFGSVGPEQSAPAELRYTNIGTLPRNASASMDLVVTTPADGGYDGNPKKNGINGAFGQISLEPGLNATFVFTFVVSGGAPGNPNDRVDPFHFSFFFFDLDQGINATVGGESIEASGFDECHLSGTRSALATNPGNDQSASYDVCTGTSEADASRTMVRATVTDTDTTLFESTLAAGGSSNNPDDPNTLSDEQKALSVGLSFRATNSFSIRYTVSGNRLRNILFTGQSNLLPVCPTPPPTPSPTLANRVLEPDQGTTDSQNGNDSRSDELMGIWIGILVLILFCCCCGAIFWKRRRRETMRAGLTYEVAKDDQRVHFDVHQVDTSDTDPPTRQGGKFTSMSVFEPLQKSRTSSRHGRVENAVDIVMDGIGNRDGAIEGLASVQETSFDGSMVRADHGSGLSTEGWSTETFSATGTGTSITAGASTVMLSSARLGRADMGERGVVSRDVAMHAAERGGQPATTFQRGAGSNQAVDYASAALNGTGKIPRLPSYVAPPAFSSPGSPEITGVEFNIGESAVPSPPSWADSAESASTGGVDYAVAKPNHSTVPETETVTTEPNLVVTHVASKGILARSRPQLEDDPDLATSVERIVATDDYAGPAGFEDDEYLLFDQKTGGQNSAIVQEDDYLALGSQPSQSVVEDSSGYLAFGSHNEQPVAVGNSDDYLAFGSPIAEPSERAEDNDEYLLTTESYTRDSDEDDDEYLLTAAPSIPRRHSDQYLAFDAASAQIATRADSSVSTEYLTFTAAHKNPIVPTTPSALIDEDEYLALGSVHRPSTLRPESSSSSLDSTADSYIPIDGTISGAASQLPTGLAELTRSQSYGHALDVGRDEGGGQELEEVFQLDQNGYFRHKSVMRSNPLALQQSVTPADSGIPDSGLSDRASADGPAEPTYGFSDVRPPAGVGHSFGMASAADSVYATTSPDGLGDDVTEAEYSTVEEQTLAGGGQALYDTVGADGDDTVPQQPTFRGPGAAGTVVLTSSRTVEPNHVAGLLGRGAAMGTKVATTAKTFTDSSIRSRRPLGTLSNQNAL